MRIFFPDPCCHWTGIWSSKRNPRTRKTVCHLHCINKRCQIILSLSNVKILDWICIFLWHITAKKPNNYIPWWKPYKLFCCYGRCRMTFSIISMFKHKKSRLLLFCPFYPCPIMQPMIGYCSFSSNVEKNRASFFIVFKTMKNILISKRFDTIILGCKSIIVRWIINMLL